MYWVNRGRRIEFSWSAIGVAEDLFFGDPKVSHGPFALKADVVQPKGKLKPSRTILEGPQESTGVNLV